MHHHCQDQCQGVFPLCFLLGVSQIGTEVFIKRVDLLLSVLPREKNQTNKNAKRHQETFESDGYVITLIVVMDSQVYLGARTLKCIY